ncbi:carbamoyltransferase [Embleya hyalina]|uniref:Carbamoyltransferase n=2 Tax=Embleya hyalina TaxID=516124 RepID=A0A401YEB4_9ACTN|nr:carbamoyltransferase [Embleya hyalina]
MDNGRLITAIQEERLSRVKNQGGTPRRAVDRVLREAATQLRDVDRVAVSTIRLRNTNLRTSADVLSVYRTVFGDPRRQVSGEEGGEEAAGQQRTRAAFLTDAGYPAENITFVDHHTCHAATAYFARGTTDRDILVLTNDGHGDGLCATVSIGRGGSIKRLAALPRADSIAALYSYVTYLLGFTPLEHEYKLMGMAPYAAGSKAAEEVCAYFESLFEFPEDQPLLWARRPGVPPTSLIAPDIEAALRFRRFDAVMAGLQMFVENTICLWVERVVAATGIADLALAGGLFMNVKLNQRINDLPSVRSTFFCPSAGDESNSLGAAWSVCADEAADGRPLRDLYVGTDYPDAEIEREARAFAERDGIRVSRPDEPARVAARLLADHNVVARFAGRMEFGARSLGNRSILAHPGNSEVRALINRMIKQRDFWMPFAPSVLAEHAATYLEMPTETGAEYMTVSFDTHADVRGRIQAAAHPHDWTCRPQILTREANPDYHRLISEFHRLTGIGAVLNTSFNLHGYPIVESPRDALDVFEASGLRYLMLGPLLIEKV